MNEDGQRYYFRIDGDESAWELPKVCARPAPAIIVLASMFILRPRCTCLYICIYKPLLSVSWSILDVKFTKEILGKIISLMTFCTPKDDILTGNQDFHCECGLSHVLHVREKLSWV